jgi:hypothetical protein
MVVVMLIAACFTELAARLHKTGSTYLYLYVTVGELPAFVVGFGILICKYSSEFSDLRMLLNSWREIPLFKLLLYLMLIASKLLPCGCYESYSVS